MSFNFDINMFAITAIILIAFFFSVCYICRQYKSSKRRPPPLPSPTDDVIPYTGSQVVIPYTESQMRVEMSPEVFLPEVPSPFDIPRLLTVDIPPLPETPPPSYEMATRPLFPLPPQPPPYEDS